VEIIVTAIGWFVLVFGIFAWVGMVKRYRAENVKDNKARQKNEKPVDKK